MKIFKALILAWLVLLSLSLSVTASTDEPPSYRLTVIAEDLAIPWGMVFLDDEQLLITEREGFVTLLSLETGNKTDISGLPDNLFIRGQGGLLDVAIPRTYPSSEWIYFSYSQNQNGLGVTVLARAKLQQDELIEWQDLFVSQSSTSSSVHFGGRMTFDNEGHLYMSIGDRGQRDNAQDLSNHAGTIVRLNLDGTIPEDNPFIADPNALDEIWSYGHRNPQGLFYNLTTGLLWSMEHGPRGGDEINLIEAGLNYGWPVISYGKEYLTPFAVGEGTHKVGMEQPVKVYVPSIAPSGLIQYGGQAFPAWRGKLFSGALKLHHLNVVTLDTEQRATEETRLLSELNARIRNVIEGPSGYLYISTDAGQIIQLSPKTNAP